MSTAYSAMLNEAKTMFKPKIGSESSTAAPASRKYENSAYT